MLNEHVRRALVAEHAEDMQRAAMIHRMIVASKRNDRGVRRLITVRRRTRQTVTAQGNLALRQVGR